MEELSRRSFLRKGSAGVAAGALAAAGLANAASAAERHTPAETDAADASTGSTSHEPIVAYVRDAAEAEVRILVGEREVVHRDPALVRRIVRASSS